MVNFPGRNGRRRRVLNDEVLSTTGGRATLRMTTVDEQNFLPMRYSEAAGVENHPQITDFIPRRYTSIAMLVLIGVGSAAALAAAHVANPTLARAVGGSDFAQFDLGIRGNLASWFAAVVLLVAAAVSLLIRSIRQHRIDDIRGRYRIWRAACLACLVLSANSVAGLHDLLSQSLSHVTGWTALRDGAVWWLTITGIPLAWIAFRMLQDVLECRLAATMGLGAIGCYLAAVVSYLGFPPAESASVEAIFPMVFTLAGHWLTLASIVSYARYVVLDAQGLIPARTGTGRAKVKTTKAPKSYAPGEAVDSSAEATSRKQTSARKVQPQDSSCDGEWIDGSSPDSEHYDEEECEIGDFRKLSKADRKRLRKLKTQRRAA